MVEEGLELVRCPNVMMATWQGTPPHPGPTPVGGITLGTWHPEFQACRSLTAAGAGPLALEHN